MSPRRDGVEASGRVRTLRAFGGWLQRELQLDGHPLAGLPIPKVPDVLVPSLTAPELRALLEAVNSTRDSIRDLAILLVLLDTGLRLGELVRLSVGDVDLIEGRCRVMGKARRSGSYRLAAVRDERCEPGSSRVGVPSIRIRSLSADEAVA